MKKGNIIRFIKFLNPVNSYGTWGNYPFNGLLILIISLLLIAGSIGIWFDGGLDFYGKLGVCIMCLIMSISSICFLFFGYHEMIRREERDKEEFDKWWKD